MIKWNSNIMFPTDSCFQNRVTKATFSPSKSSGSPMVTLETEVVAPTMYEVGEDQVNLAGVACQYYLVTTSLDKAGNIDEEKTANSRARFKDFWSKIELDPETINWDNVDVSSLKGK